MPVDALAQCAINHSFNPSFLFCNESLPCDSEACKPGSEEHKMPKDAFRTREIQRHGVSVFDLLTVLRAVPNGFYCQRKIAVVQA